jgi:Tol biopolymer transport system component
VAGCTIVIPGGGDGDGDGDGDSTGRIAFHSDRDGDREILVMNVDGGNQTRLTDNGSLVQYPAWCPVR